MSQSIKSSRISVIVAVFNQEAYLPELHGQLVQTFSEHIDDYELIYVDDGSKDNSWQVISELPAQDVIVKRVKLRTSFGESAVLDAGIKAAEGEQILYFTCRVRSNPKDLLKLLGRLDEGNDVVMGLREPRRDSKLNQFVSRLFNSMTNRMTHVGLNDINSGVMALHRGVLEHVPFYGSLNAFIPVLAHRQGYKVVEEPIEQLPGQFEQSLYPKNYIKRLLDFLSVIFISKYSKKPLHFLGFMGAIFTLIGAIINIYLFIYRILGVGPIAGRPMLLLGVLMVIIGIQLISIGLLGEMIIYTHANEIEDYNIEEIIE